MNPVLELRGVSFSYKGAKRPSLKDVDLAIGRKERTVIMGANGAGKSTLFHHLNGILKPDRGAVLFGGEPVSYRRKGLRALRSKVSLVMQNPDDQIFGQTVEADASYGPRNLGLPEDEVASRAEEALSQIPERDGCRECVESTVRALAQLDEGMAEILSKMTGGLP